MSIISKAKHGDMAISDARKLRAPEEENRPHSTMGFLTPKEFAQKEKEILLENSDALWQSHRDSPILL
jgi:hypothetical protein